MKILFKLLILTILICITIVFIFVEWSKESTKEIPLESPKIIRTQAQALQDHINYLIIEHDDLSNPEPVEKMKLIEIDTRVTKNEQFTVVIETYNREDIYKQVIENYCNLPLVKEILLVWNNVNIKAPHPNDFRCNVSIRVLPQNTSDVQNRLLVGATASTEAVFQCDDDFIIYGKDVLLGFETWRRYRDTIVGFSMRWHGYNSTTGELKYLRKQTSYYSIALGQAMFIHRNYLKLYAGKDERMAMVRYFVTTEYQCCDDIAMNFISTSQSRSPPIYIRSTFKDLKSKFYKGKEKEKGFKPRRALAIKKFSEIFGYNPLKYNDMVIARLNNSIPYWRKDLYVSEEIRVFDDYFPD